MLSPDVLFAFFAASLLLGVAPGPDNIFVLTQSAVHGAGAGGATTLLGLVTGLCVHTIAVALGVAVLLQSSPVAFAVLKAAGAAYLLYLARLSFRAGSLPAGGGSAPFPGYGALYRRGIVIEHNQPEGYPFFLAFLPQFCDPARSSVALQVLCLGSLFIAATILMFFAVAALGGRLAVRFNRCPRCQVFVHRLAGMVFAGLAVFLLVS
ncbi:threonine transporter RhtB [Deltaproteobacteria bacterium]|nr:threonine transporter RhtB [Deltaproteobacteria bacterium]